MSQRGYWAVDVNALAAGNHDVLLKNEIQRIASVTVPITPQNADTSIHCRCGNRVLGLGNQRLR